MGKPPLKLLDRVRYRIRLKDYSIRTEQAYTGWIRRFIIFHNKRHPRDMGKPEIEAFLTNLAVKCNVASSTQNQAFNALLFLHRNLLEIKFPNNTNSFHSKRSARLPTVLSHSEAIKVVSMMNGHHQLMTKILYGSGLRAIECIRLRIKDIAVDSSQILFRNGKGKKDRATILPEDIKDALRSQLKFVNQLHKYDIGKGFGRVYLPNALSRKYKKRR